MRVGGGGGGHGYPTTQKLIPRAGQGVPTARQATANVSRCRPLIFAQPGRRASRSSTQPGRLQPNDCSSGACCELESPFVTGRTCGEVGGEGETSRGCGRSASAQRRLAIAPPARGISESNAPIPRPLSSSFPPASRYFGILCFGGFLEAPVAGFVDALRCDTGLQTDRPVRGSSSGRQLVGSIRQGRESDGEFARCSTWGETLVRRCRAANVKCHCRSSAETMADSLSQGNRPPLEATRVSALFLLRGAAISTTTPSSRLHLSPLAALLKQLGMMRSEK